MSWCRSSAPGDLDIVATGLDGITLLRGDGSAAVTRDATKPGDGFEPGTLALADLDQDGDLDVVGGRYDAKEIELFWNDGDGTFADATGPLDSSGSATCSRVNVER